MYGSSSENRGTSLRLGFLSAWTRLKLVVLASQCGTVAFAGIFDKPQGGFGFSRFATNQSHTEGWLAWQNLSNGDDLPPTSSIEMSSRFLAESSMLQFAEDEESIESEEEVVTCEMHLIADFPLGLIGEAGILILEATRITLQLRKNYVVLTGSISSPSVDGDVSIPDGIVMQTFRFDLAVLPPKGGSADISFMLRKAAESAILIKFQDLVRSSEAMKEVEVNNYWLLLMPVPSVVVETVLRPVVFETWTSTPEPLPYIPVITTTVAPQDPRDCTARSSPCTCAGISTCEWVKVNDQAQCQQGNGGVPCSACENQEECLAKTCGGLTAACRCANSHLGCHYDSTSGICLEGAGTTRCSACATQSHCQPPEIVSFVPAAGSQLTIPANRQLQLDFDRTVRLKQTGSISFTCSAQPLPFYVPWEHVEESPSRTGIRISIAKLLEANFKTTRECTLEIGYGVVVDNADVPFTGLAKDLYSFKLGDTVQPSVIEFEPANGQSDVAAGGSVRFRFNEDVVLTSGNSRIIVYEGTDSSGNPKALVEFKMSSPSVAFSTREISVDLSQFTKGYEQYSVDLPSQAISDTAGNLFAGIPAGFYTFRTRGTQTVEAEAIQGLSDYMPLMVAGGGGLAIAIGGLVLWRLCRLTGMKKSSVRPAEISPKDSIQATFEKEDLELDASGTFGSTWTGTSLGNQGDDINDSSGRSWAQKVRSPGPQAQWQNAFVKSSVSRKGLAGAGSATATLNRSSSHGPAGAPNGPSNPSSPKPATPSGPRPTFGEFQSKAFSKRSNASTSYSNLGGGKENPRDSTHQSQSSQSKSNSKPQTPSAKADSATDFSNDAAEVKSKKLAIEKKLRDLMDKPIAERKKALREMMLEYHPDKSSDEHAKEVFQFINASRSWFLVET